MNSSKTRSTKTSTPTPRTRRVKAAPKQYVNETVPTTVSIDIIITEELLTVPEGMIEEPTPVEETVDLSTVDRFTPTVNNVIKLNRKIEKARYTSNNPFLGGHDTLLDYSIYASTITGLSILFSFFFLQGWNTTLGLIVLTAPLTLQIIWTLAAGLGEFISIRAEKKLTNLLLLKEYVANEYSDLLIEAEDETARLKEEQASIKEAKENSKLTKKLQTQKMREQRRQIRRDTKIAQQSFPLFK